MGIKWGDGKRGRGEEKGAVKQGPSSGSLPYSTCLD